MSGKLIHSMKRKHEDEYNANNSDNGRCGKRINAHSENTSDNKSNNNSDDETNSDETNSVASVDFLKEALKKVESLERELHEIDEYDSDCDEASDEGVPENYSEIEENARAFEAEALGFALCAREALTFLANEGLSMDNPLVQSLRNRLIGKCHSVPI